MTDIEHIEGELVTSYGTSLLPGDPVSQAEYAVEVGRTLAELAKTNGWAIKIKNRDYLKAEGWQFVGSQLGLVPGTEWTRRLNKNEHGIDGWEARVVITHLDSGNVVGSGESMCDRGEITRKRDGTLYKRWENEPENALRSMAQTRATSRAFRNVLGWAASAGGFSSTPAEEVPPEGWTRDGEPEHACPACDAPMRYTGPQKKAGKDISGRWWCTDGKNCPGEDSDKFGATVWQKSTNESFESARDRWWTENPTFRPDHFDADRGDVSEHKIGADGIRHVVDDVMGTLGFVEDHDRGQVQRAVKVSLNEMKQADQLQGDDDPMILAMNSPAHMIDEIIERVLAVIEREPEFGPEDNTATHDGS